MNFNNFWSNVSLVRFGKQAPNETFKEVMAAIQSVQPKKDEDES